MGKIAGSDGGWGVLISSQLFIPVSLHRGEQERKRKRGKEGGREGEMQSGEGGWEATATAASMHRCSLLNVSISSTPSPSTLPPSFDLPPFAMQTHRHQMASALQGRTGRGGDHSNELGEQ